MYTPHSLVAKLQRYNTYPVLPCRKTAAAQYVPRIPLSQNCGDTIRTPYSFVAKLREHNTYPVLPCRKTAAAKYVPRIHSSTLKGVKSNKPTFMTKGKFF